MQDPKHVHIMIYDVSTSSYHQNIYITSIVEIFPRKMYNCESNFMETFYWTYLHEIYNVYVLRILHYGSIFLMKEEAFKKGEN